MNLKRTCLLYILGLVAVTLAALFPSISWLSPLTYMLIFPAAAIWLWKSEGHSLGELGFHFNPGWARKLAIGLAAGLAIPLFFIALEYTCGWVILTSRIGPVGAMMRYLIILFPKMIAIVAIEELVFRGFFLQALSRKTGFLIATLLSSLLWALGHLVSMVQARLAPALILLGLVTFLLWGLTLSLCVVRTGRSLWLAYGLHLGSNLSFSLVGLFVILQPRAPIWWLGHPALSPESGLIGVVVWLDLALAAAWLTGAKRLNEFTPGKTFTSPNGGS